MLESVKKKVALNQGDKGWRPRKSANLGEGRHAPAQLERLVAGLGKRPVADLRAQVVDHHIDRADVRLDRGDSLLDGAGSHGVQHEARRSPAVGGNAGDRTVQAFLIRPPAEDRVVPRAGEALSDMAPDAGTGTDHETDILH